MPTSPSKAKESIKNNFHQRLKSQEIEEDMKLQELKEKHQQIRNNHRFKKTKVPTDVNT